MFWDTANQTMHDPATQSYWTQCGGKPCAGVWSSPAGNTPKYWINYSNPAAVDWWLNTYIGATLRNSLIDSIYFDCSCGQPPGDAFLNSPATVSRFAADAQAAFDRALAMIKAAGKWASAWNSEGMGTSIDPVWKGITPDSCHVAMDSWLTIGANDDLALQTLAVAFFAKGHNPFKPSAPPGPPAPPAPPQPLPGCSYTVTDGFCARAPGSTVLSTRLHTSQLTCCKLCMANPACKSWTLDSRNASRCACYLQAFVNKPSQGTNASGCTSGVPPPPPAVQAAVAPLTSAPQLPPQPYFSQNNTLAAFLIARGAGGGFLELPVCGAFESMADYDLSNPLLQQDLGTPMGAGRRTAKGVYTREFSKATVSLSCETWSSVFEMK